MDETRRRETARAGSALLVIAVAALAAAAAHIAIDAIGDVVLVHDTYDDVAHHSYTVMAAAAGAALLAAASRSLYDALCVALGRRAARSAFSIAAPVRFCATVLALAIPMVLAMEAVDAFVAGRATDDLGDLFGGSIALGAATTVSVALAVAVAAVVCLRFFCTTRALLMRAVSGFIQQRARRAAAPLYAIRRRRARALVRGIRRRDAAKRGPPHLVPG